MQLFNVCWPHVPSKWPLLSIPCIHFQMQTFYNESVTQNEENTSLHPLIQTRTNHLWRNLVINFYVPPSDCSDFLLLEDTSFDKSVRSLGGSGTGWNPTVPSILVIVTMLNKQQFRNFFLKHKNVNLTVTLILPWESDRYRYWLKKKKKKKSSMIIIFWRTRWSSAQSVNLCEVLVSDRVTLPQSGLFTLHSGFFPKAAVVTTVGAAENWTRFLNFLDILKKVQHLMTAAFKHRYIVERCHTLVLLWICA